MAYILVADDDADQVAVQRELLETFGYQVGTARSPAEMLTLLDREHPDLAIMDLRFPLPSDGLALIRGIRGKNATLPLIVLSGWPDELYGAPEEPLVSRVVIKGNVRELLQTIAEVLAK
ncbi:MAG TPA: response regulator [Bryobacteraceae bacterium]|jgi:CheY-like chemotaxis protein|nr:response regulator [Bryobacteraceae bacterium]